MSESSMAEKVRGPDLSKFEQFFSRPQEVRAKKLRSDKIYKIIVNGKETEVVGNKGDWDVYVLKKNGEILRNEPYTDEIFHSKFGKKDAQGELVFKNDPEPEAEGGDDEE